MPPQRTTASPYGPVVIHHARIDRNPETRRLQSFVMYMMIMSHSLGAAAAYQYLYPLYNKLPLHDSPMTGSMVLDRWLSHPNSSAMQAQLGVSPHAFRFLYGQLRELGDLSHSKYISADLKLAVFLYICREALGVRHAAETFQVSLESIAKWVHLLLPRLPLKCLSTRLESIHKYSLRIEMDATAHSRLPSLFCDLEQQEIQSLFPRCGRRSGRYPCSGIHPGTPSTAVPQPKADADHERDGSVHF